MASYIIDRRLNGKHKSAVNRQRFLNRYRKHIREAVADAVSKRSITDTERGENISIPRKDVSEPIFKHSRGGRQNRVLPGNKEFIAGDKIKRPQGGGGAGGPGDASNQGEGLDDFVFQLSQEEYLDFIFEDLELPNLIKKQLLDSDSSRIVKGGYSSDGIPPRLNVLQSMRSAQGRRIALSGAIKRRIKELKKRVDALQLTADLDAQKHSDVPGDAPVDQTVDAAASPGSSQRDAEIRTLKLELERQERRLNHIPFLDDLDLKYNQMIELPMPASRAVMFCILDVSGSMTSEIKDMAKRFFILLHLFLKRNYRKVDVVFIRHHTVASEVDEDEFFYSRETGGTVVSSALTLLNQIIDKRYPSQDWNIYAAQASDGDNWGDDSPKCRDLLMNSILSKLQYYTYVEVTPRNHQSLWQVYSEIPEQFPDRFAMQEIHSLEDIYPVFHGLFERKTN